MRCEICFDDIDFDKRDNVFCNNARFHAFHGECAGNYLVGTVVGLHSVPTAVDTRCPCHSSSDPCTVAVSDLLDGMTDEEERLRMFSRIASAVVATTDFDQEIAGNIVSCGECISEWYELPAGREPSCPRCGSRMERRFVPEAVVAESNKRKREEDGDAIGKTEALLKDYSQGCPRCTLPCTRPEGCNHMTCPEPCRHEWCWGCRLPWRNSRIPAAERVNHYHCEVTIKDLTDTPFEEDHKRADRLRMEERERADYLAGAPARAARAAAMAARNVQRRAEEVVLAAARKAVAQANADARRARFAARQSSDPLFLTGVVRCQMCFGRSEPSCPHAAFLPRQPGCQPECPEACDCAFAQGYRRYRGLPRRTAQRRAADTFLAVKPTVYSCSLCGIDGHTQLQCVTLMLTREAQAAASAALLQTAAAHSDGTCTGGARAS